MSGWFASIANAISNTSSTTYNIGDANMQGSTIGNFSAYGAEGLASLFGMDNSTAGSYGGQVGTQLAAELTGVFGSSNASAPSSSIAGANSTTANTGSSTLDSVLNYGSSLLGGSGSPTAMGETTGQVTSQVLSKITIGSVMTVIVGALLILGGLWMFSSSDMSNSLSSISDSIGKIVSTTGGKAAEAAEVAT
jgi:hypothetical protein